MKIEAVRDVQIRAPKRKAVHGAADAIAFVDVTCRFGNVVALDRVSFSVPNGSIFGIIGPNGAGKTTMMRCALGLIAPVSGTTRVLGEEGMSDSPQLRRRIGVLLEHTGLHERLSASANLDFFGRLYGMSASTRGLRTREMLERAELWDRRNDLVGTWSKGMKQQLALARALLHDPELVLLDEPTSGLDPLAAFAFRARLKAFAEEHRRTIVIATHLLHEAEALCDMVAIVRGGRVVTVASPEQLRARAGKQRLTISARAVAANVLEALRAQPGVASVDIVDGALELELTGEGDPAEVISLLVGYGVSVDAVQRTGPSFEDVCLALLGAA